MLDIVLLVWHKLIHPKHELIWKTSVHPCNFFLQIIPEPKLILHRSTVTRTLTCGKRSFSTASLLPADGGMQKTPIARYETVDVTWLDPWGYPSQASRWLIQEGHAANIFYYMHTHKHYNSVKLHWYYLFQDFTV